MAANDYISHTDSLGRDPFVRMTQLGYTLNTTQGENLAAGTETAADTLLGWQNSAAHNANLLRPEFTVMGLARAYRAGTTYGWYWAQEFGGALDQEALLQSVNRSPEGFYDGTDCLHVWGWARDPDSSPPVRIQVFRDAPAASGGIFLEEFIASQFREDGGDRVGFRWAIPESFKAGDSRIWILTPQDDTGVRQRLSDTAFSRLGYDRDALYEINVADRDAYVEGAPIN